MLSYTEDVRRPTKFCIQSTSSLQPLQIRYQNV
jgi:hypothetical protein